MTDHTPTEPDEPDPDADEGVTAEPDAVQGDADEGADEGD